METFRQKLNDALSERLKKNGGFHEEIKVFCIIEVSNRFNAKINTSHREYSYYLPSFTLGGIDEFFLGRSQAQIAAKREETAAKREEGVTSVKVVNGITVTKRFENEDDARDL